MMKKTAIIAERLKRQRLTHPIKQQKDYVALFRLLQPLSTIAYVYPGSPAGVGASPDV